MGARIDDRPYKRRQLGGERIGSGEGGRGTEIGGATTTREHGRSGRGGGGIGDLQERKRSSLSAQWQACFGGFCEVSGDEEYGQE